MVEHLVYTERVGGSSPSPPTKARAALLGALALLLALAGLGLSPQSARASASAMTFRLAHLESVSCRKHCPGVIVADGVIEEGTPQAFADFIAGASVEPNLRAVVFMDSPGGQVVASMKLGALFRKLHVVGIVGRIETINGREGPVAGSCVSACIYAFMGALKRIIPPESRVATHRMSATEKTFAQVFFGGPGNQRFADRDMVDALARYAASMGVSTALVREAESHSPDEIHVLSGVELRRWRLETSAS